MATTVTSSTTTVSEGGAAKGNKPVSIVLMIFGAVGILLGAVAIIYSAVGANIALEASGLEALQDACAATFSTATENGYVSYDDGSCSFASGSFPIPSLPGTSPAPPAGGGISTSLMCGASQLEAGCSYAAHKLGFQVASALGMGATIAGSFFVIIASIPVLTNGIYGFLSMEAAARVSGGFGVGCAIPGVIGASICSIVLLVAAGIGKVWAGTVEALADLRTNGEICTTECRASLDATAQLGGYIADYYQALTIMMVIMIFVALIESIVACVSCCFWKKQVTVVTTNVTCAPVVAAPMVAQPVVAVEMQKQ